MQLAIYILSLFVAFQFTSCKANETAVVTDQHLYVGDFYVNENGLIQLNKINDTLMSVLFQNNEGQRFDTVMKICTHENFKLAYGNYPFLKWHMGGIQMYEHTIQVVEFSSLAYICQYIQIPNIYERPFYKSGDTIQLSGLIKRSKGDLLLNGIYLNSDSLYENDFIVTSGVLRKEKFPRSYYSTNESPQGMFGDTNVVHYRLVFEPITTKKIEQRTMTGSLQNINGEAAFVYDFADSEVFYVDSVMSWNQDQIGKRVVLEGYLVQFENQKSMIKNWRIITE